MDGKLGVLYQDNKQVGGFFDWDIHLVSDFTTVRGWKTFKPKKKISARSYYLVEKLKDNQFVVEFYDVVKTKLVLMDKGEAVVDLPDSKTLDRRLDAPIDIVWVKGEY